MAKRHRLKIQQPRLVLSNGTKKWYLGQHLHRTDGPAVECPDVRQEWYFRGKRHRDGGPAITATGLYEEWYQHGKRHRDGGPAITRINGTYEWYWEGKLHRIGGPAVLKADGTRLWIQHGKWHREDGPALERPDGYCEWRLYGVPRLLVAIAQMIAEELGMVWSEKRAERVMWVCGTNCLEFELYLNNDQDGVTIAGRTVDTSMMLPVFSYELADPELSQHFLRDVRQAYL